jgi:hypothetical protein
VVPPVPYRTHRLTHSTMSDSTPAAAVNSAETAAGVSGAAFVPKETVNVVVGKQNANLYPRVQPMWSIEERAYAYHVTSTALKGLHLPSDVYLDSLGVYLDCQTVVAGLKTDFIDHFKDNWLNMAHLEILSFHSTAGGIVPNCTIANNPTILKPVQDGANANCRPADVRYVRLQLVLDYAELATGASPNENTTLRCQYYLELPQTLEVVLDGNGNPRTLVTYHGPADLSTLSVADIQDQVLHQVPQDAPVGLAEAPFNVTNATIDESVMDVIQRSIYKLAISTIEKDVFQHLCPGYTNKPHAAVEGITQTYPDAAGNIKCYSVAEYSSLLTQAAGTFAHQREYPTNLCGIFMRGLHPDIRSNFETLYPEHSEPHDRNGRFQRTAYAKILKLATQAESNVHSTQKIVARQMGQTFTANADTFASQAERTFQQYQGNSPRATTPPSSVLGKGHKCHGCDGPHPFSECPDKHKPHVIARAKRTRAEFFDKKIKGKRGRWQCKEPNLTDLSPAAQAKITQQVLDNQNLGVVSSNVSETSSLTGASPSPAVGRGMGRGSTVGRGGGKPFIFLGNVFSLASATKEILPVPISTNLPHIRLQLGSSDMKADMPVISCTVDSAAAICIGNSHFFFQIAKTFPGSVVAVYTPENYSPIILSGIVQRNGEAVTTDLCVAFVFQLPYFTKDGEPAQIMFGAGPHVNVNCILGIPFITASRMLLDFHDNVAECRSLDCPPFPLEFKKAHLCLPDVQASMVSGHEAEDYSDFLADLEKLEAHVHSLGAVPSTQKKLKRVQFSSRESRDPLDDGLSRYRPSAEMLNRVMPRESLDTNCDLAGESQSAVFDDQE